MTREEEAIKLIEHISIAFMPTDQYGDYDDPRPYEEALDMAIEALRREIPKNPVINFLADSDGSRRLDEAWREDSLLCPECHTYVGEVFDELYCRKCGQKIVQKRVMVIK